MCPSEYPEVQIRGYQLLLPEKEFAKESEKDRAAEKPTKTKQSTILLNEHSPLIGKYSFHPATKALPSPVFCNIFFSQWFKCV